MRSLSVSVATLIMLTSSLAAAQEAPSTDAQPIKDQSTDSKESKSDGASAPPPSMSSWQLRGTSTGTQVRADSTVAPFTNGTKSYLETIGLLSGSLRLSDMFAVQARMGAIQSDPSGAGNSSSGITNAALSGQFALSLGSGLRFAASTGVVLPTASGSGSTPNADVVAAMKAAQYARSYMDNSLFSTNGVTIPVGADLSWTIGRFMTQAEMTVSEFVRTEAANQTPDANKLSLAAGLFAGYFVIPDTLSIGAELHNYVYLSTPVAVAKDSTQRDDLSGALGVRMYFPVSETVSMRPGLSYGAGLYGAIADNHTQMVQIDLPVSF